MKKPFNRLEKTAIILTIPIGLAAPFVLLHRTEPNETLEGGSPGPGWIANAEKGHGTGEGSI